jgi:uncharacterized protein involved in outer membrane biogenesis
MAPDPKQIRNQVTAIARHPRTRKIAIWFVAIFVAVGVLLGLVAPPLLRGKIASELSKTLHREVSIAQIRINPYAMTVAVRGFSMKERQSQAAAVSFDELFVNLDIRSLFRLAPVIQEFRLTKPYVSLIRGTDYKYNFQDLIDEFTKGPSGPTPRFAVNNIEILDGRVDFDDQPEQTKHSITAIKLGLPFISSLPSYADIKVKPALSFVVNGAPVHLAGDATTPFKDSLDSTLSVDINDVEIPKYLEYSPVTLNFKIPSGELAGKITASFKTAKGKPAVLSIRGNLGLKQFEMQQPTGAAMVKLPAFSIVIDDYEVLANKLTIKSVGAQNLDLNLVRGHDGNLNFSNLVAAPANPPSPEPKKDGTPFNYSVDEINITPATVQFTDEQPQRPYKTRLENLALKITALSNQADKKANIELSFESDAKEAFSQTGTIQLTPLLAECKLEIRALQLKNLRPYYEDLIGVEFKDGLLDLTTQVTFAEKGETPEVKLSELNAALRSLRMDVPGESEPLWRVPLLAVKDTTIDVNKRSVVIGSVESRDGNGYVQREKDGTISYARLIKTRASENPTTQPAKAEQESSWSVNTKRLDLSRFKIVFEDRSLAAPAHIVVSNTSLHGENFSNVEKSRGKATFQATINDKGTLKFTGTVGTRPVTGQLEVDARGIDVLPFQPYLEDRVNFLFTSGSIGTKGNLVFDTSGNGPAKVNYDGNVDIADFATIEKSNSNDLLKWKSLNLNALQFNLEPFKLSIGEINLGDFYSRLILGADGKMNLQKLTPQTEEKKAEPPAEKTAAKAPEAKAPDKPEPAAPSPAAEEKAITIGKINLTDGNVNFTDLFIKPNYNANLTGVQGSISELKPEAPGDLDIQARLDNAAPVVIKGKLNPLSKDLFLDIVADAKEIELSPMTPYSGRYVGYGIEKGKLSFNVKYKLENRKLSAENKIILNQLTFGEKVDSPDATKLPVLFAVSLLKDRNGVIDIDLPISGSLDDPQFSVGGIVWRIIINIITKAVTAPFSLLASAFGSGGSGEELSYIEFDNGRATINQAGQAKIATLAKALNNRPALNLELTGRVDPASDLEGLKRVSMERKVKAQKLKVLVRRGEAQKSVDDVQIESGEYAQYLKDAYGDESFPKPRNIIGLAQNIPVPEMEKLMLQNTKVGDDDLRQLASQRAQAVRDALLATGQFGAERLFIVAAKPLTSDELAKIKGKPNRVDFSMK